MLASGAPAALVRTLPWYNGTHKDAVQESIKTYSPKPREEAVAVTSSTANPWVTN